MIDCVRHALHQSVQSADGPRQPAPGRSGPDPADEVAARHSHRRASRTGLAAGRPGGRQCRRASATSVFRSARSSAARTCTSPMTWQPPRCRRRAACSRSCCSTRQSFGPSIRRGLSAKSLVPGSYVFGLFFRDFQAVIDSGDPINHIADAVAMHPVLPAEGHGRPRRAEQLDRSPDRQGRLDEGDRAGTGPAGQSEVRGFAPARAATRSSPRAAHGTDVAIKRPAKCCCAATTARCSAGRACSRPRRAPGGAGSAVISPTRRWLDLN